MYKFIGTEEIICLHDSHELAHFSGHDLQPCHIFLRLLTINDMRTVHAVGSDAAEKSGRPAWAG